MGGGATVAKKRGRPKTSERDDATIRIDRLVARRLKAVADYRGASVAELATEMLRGPVDREFAKMVSEMQREGGGK
jgi:hypothetical protein